MMMTTLMVVVTKLPAPVNYNFDEIECALFHCGLLKGIIKHAKQAVFRGDAIIGLAKKKGGGGGVGA